MKMQLDVKSLVLGAVVGCLALVSVAAVGQGSGLQLMGRFQLMMNDQYIYKIDTKTGQVWKGRAHSAGSSIMNANIPE